MKGSWNTSFEADDNEGYRTNERLIITNYYKTSYENRIIGMNIQEKKNSYRRVCGSNGVFPWYVITTFVSIVLYYSMVTATVQKSGNGERFPFLFPPKCSTQIGEWGRFPSFLVHPKRRREGRLLSAVANIIIDLDHPQRYSGSDRSFVSQLLSIQISLSFVDNQ